MTRYSVGCALACLVLVVGASAGPHSRNASTVRGRITAVDSTEPLRGAKVKIAGLGTAITDAQGRYKVRTGTNIAGTWKTVISAADYRRRKTWLVIPDATTKAQADWNLLPKKSESFDLRLFDELVRFAGRGVGTTRWDNPPTFRILRNRLECPDEATPTANCPVWVTSSTPASGKLIALYYDAMSSVPPLLGGQDAIVNTVSLTPGTTITREELLVAGTFTLGEHAGGRLSLSFPRHEDGDTIVSSTFLSASLAPLDRKRALLFIARGLGYVRTVGSVDLCDDLLARQLLTVFCRSHYSVAAATALDGILGRAFYSRGIGNRFPDVDPRPADDIARAHRSQGPP